MKYTRAFAAAFAVALMVLTISSTSKVQAQVTPVKNHYEIVQSGALYCEETGLINWSGSIAIKVHSVTDANGGTHYEVIADFSKVDGIDGDGNKYQGSGRQATRINNPTGDTHVHIGTYSYRLVGKNGKGITCTGTYHVVMNANGETTVSVNQPTVCECK